MEGTKSTKKVIVIGGTGSIGVPLCLELVKQNYHVIVFTRNIERAKLTKLGSVSASTSLQFVQWCPDEIPQDSSPAIYHDVEITPPTPNAKEQLLVEALSSSLCVINLAGNSVYGRRSKGDIQQQRLTKVALIRQILYLTGMCDFKPKLYLNASSVGFYGKIANDFDEEVNEESKHGCDFWGHGTEIIETEARAFTTKYGVPVINMRIGVVLDKEGGVLKAQAPKFKNGSGSIVGTGKQWVPWIHIDDVVGMFLFAIRQAEIATRNALPELYKIWALNVTSPNPIRQEDFAKTLAEVLGAPLSKWKKPLWILKLGMGKPAELISKTKKVVPDKALALGYKFKFLSIQAALKKELAVPPAQN